MEKAKVSPGGLLIVAFSFNVLATVFPISGMSHVAKSSAWISSIVAGVVGMGVVGIWLAARPTQPATSVPDWFSQVLGRFGGFVINSLYLLFFLIMCGITLRHIVELVSTAILPKTPNVVVLFLFAVTAAVVARLGIEVITRSAQVYIGITLLAYLLLIVGVGPYVQFENLQPILDKGMRPVVVGAIPSIAAVSLTGIGIWASPYLHGRATLVRVTALAALFSGLSIILINLLAQGLFSYRGVENMLIPALAVARSVRLGRILERLDVALLGGWLVIAFVATAFLIYLAGTQVAWLGRTRHYRPFVLPVAVIASTMALVLVRSDAELSEWVNTGAFSPYVLFHTLVLPILILLLHLFRRPQPGREPDSKGAD